jgi:hypothetical protein
VRQDFVIVATVLFTLLCVAKSCCHRKQQFASQAANDKKNDPENVRVVIAGTAIPRNVESHESDQREFVPEHIPSRQGPADFVPPPMLAILPSLAAAATSARGGLSAQDEAEMSSAAMSALEANSGEALSKWRDHFGRVGKKPKDSEVKSEEILSKSRGRYEIVGGKSPSWGVELPMHKRGSKRV